MLSPTQFLDITVAILTKNSAIQIEKCLNAIPKNWRVQILDDGSIDETLLIINNYPIRIHQRSFENFADRRNYLLNQCETSWIFYLDSDELLTSELIKSIRQKMDEPPNCYRIYRQNYFLGTKTYIDIVDRLFHKTLIRGWLGKVHESPDIKVDSTLITTGKLLHFTHTDITTMMTKTNSWSEIESELRMEVNHPAVSWWRIVRIGITFFIREFIGKKLYKFGRSGLFESYFQAIDKIIVYTKLWEKQHTSNFKSVIG